MTAHRINPCPLTGVVATRSRRRLRSDIRFYDPNQPRDWHGRWTEGGGSASSEGVVIKDIDARMEKVIKEKKHVGESKECVALVKHLAPELGRAADWQEGPKIKGMNDPPLEPGTPVATFENGRYKNLSAGNHAGVFLGYGEREGRVGFWLLDQSRRFTPKKSFKQFGKTAERYSVIKNTRR